MEARAAIPVTLPYRAPTVSYWQDPPDAEIADYMSSPTLPEELVDMVIVGSGITGAGVAWGLLGADSPEKRSQGRVVMLEARQACSGATGRNGGHTKAASYRSFPSTAASYSLSTAITVARFEYANIKTLHTFARQHDIDCDLFSGDTVDIVYDSAQWDSTVKAVGLMRDAMPGDLEGAAKYQLWTAEEARERFFVDDDLGGYGEVKGALFTNTPVLALAKSSSGIWTVETAKGIVKAKKVVLATNGYTAFLAPQFQGSIVPLRGQITAHRPGSNMPAAGLPTTYSFIYTNGYEYMIPRPPGSKFAGDIVIGGGLVKAKDEGLGEFGNTDDSTVNTEISEYLTGTTKRYFGKNWGEDDAEGRVRREWTGIMGYSGDGFPFVGAVPGDGVGNGGLWVAASFQGHGMVLCWMCAKALVAMTEGREEDIKGWFPEVFKVTKDRLGVKFRGRLHTKPLEKEG